MSEDEAGYEELAAHMAELGKVRRVYSGPNGGLAIVDGDGGSSPAQRLGVTGAAHGYYGGDMEHGYYAVAQAGSGPEQCPACHGAAGCICTSGDVETALWLELNAIRKHLARLDAALGVVEDRARVEGGTRFRQNASMAARLPAVETEVAGLRANVGNVEHRCTCTEQAAAECDRLQAQAAQRKEAQK